MNRITSTDGLIEVWMKLMEDRERRKMAQQDLRGYPPSHESRLVIEVADLLLDALLRGELPEQAIKRLRELGYDYKFDSTFRTLEIFTKEG